MYAARWFGLDRLRLRFSSISDLPSSLDRRQYRAASSSLIATPARAARARTAATGDVRWVSVPPLSNSTAWNRIAPPLPGVLRLAIDARANAVVVKHERAGDQQDEDRVAADVHWGQLVHMERPALAIHAEPAGVGDHRHRGRPAQRADEQRNADQDHAPAGAAHVVKPLAGLVPARPREV